jgi:hypothetical protein
MPDLRRRQFLTLSGAAVAWPLAARAQQPGMPVVGFVEGRSAEATVRQAAAFRKAFSETGYIEGQNVTVEYHWLDGQYAAYTQRDFVEPGGLMSYKTDIPDMFRQVGVYTGQILKGMKPADLPLLQSIKFEFVINMQTARALGLEVPPQLLASADEVIE